MSPTPTLKIESISQKSAAAAVPSYCCPLRQRTPDFREMASNDSKPADRGSTLGNSVKSAMKPRIWYNDSGRDCDAYMDPTLETPTVVSFGADVLDRMVLAVELVKQRLQRSTAALEASEIPYAVIGGNAVAAWVSQIDPAAAQHGRCRSTCGARFRTSQVRDGFGGFRVSTCRRDRYVSRWPERQAGEAVHVIFAGEKVRKEYVAPARSITECERHQAFRVLSFESLVKMKLTSFRLKDQVHIQDMIDVGLLDYSWLDRLPAELAPRLKELLDHPER